MDFRETWDKLRENSKLQRDLGFLGVSLLIGLVFVGAHNLVTPNEKVEVGYIEVHTDCYGVQIGEGICLGIERRDHETFNYADYQEPEPGTENFYRRVESELMLQAYNICKEDMKGMEWLSEASYRNRTGEEWIQNENVQLLPCEKTFFREMKSSS